MAVLEIKQIVRVQHDVPIKADGEQSIGNFIDDYVTETIQEGHEIISVELHLSEDDTARIRDSLMASGATIGKKATKTKTAY